MGADSSCVTLSVVVPVYNIVSYIDRCVESIVRQTYRDLEIILVDDGSTDGSGEKCDLWVQKDTRIRVIHKPNGGVVSARQTGVEAATGDYLAQVDGDDWIEKEMYAEMLELALSCDADIVTLGLVRDYVGHSIINSEAFEPGVYKGVRLEEEFLPHIIDMKHFFRSRVNGHITTKIYKTELIRHFQMRLSMEAIIGDDVAVVYPCFWAANCVAVLGCNYYHYVMRPGSVMDTRGNEDVSMEAIKNALKEAADRYTEKVPNIKRQIELLLLYISLHIAPQKVLKCKENEIYPFGGLKKGDRILLYGAGRFGKTLHGYMQESGECEIVAWVDKVETEGIIPIEEALRRPYDKVVIAVLLADIVEEIISELISRGVDDHKIVCISL